jgi:hypothetical protein
MEVLERRSESASKVSENLFYHDRVAHDYIGTAAPVKLQDWLGTSFGTPVSPQPESPSEEGRSDALTGKRAHDLSYPGERH